MLALRHAQRLTRVTRFLPSAARPYSSETYHKWSSAFSIDSDRLWNDIHHTAQWSGPTDGGLNRLCADDNDKLARDWFRDQAHAIGAEYKVNSVGAQFAILPGEDSRIPPIAMGSHLDSVVTGGKFDGVLGVTSGLEVLRSFKEHGIRTRAPVAVINWTNEEGSRFVPVLGASSVWAEVHTVEEVHASVPHDGSPVTLGSELERIGYVGNAPSTYSEFPLSAHFEIHNEQNTELEQAGKSIGWAKNWQGMASYEVTFRGEDGHATTYNMKRRKDALVGAARLITTLEDLAHELEGFSTPTAIRTGPFGFCNIQSKARINFLIGNKDQTKLEEICKGFELAADAAAAAHGLTYSLKKVLDSPVGEFTREAVDCATRACGEKGMPITCMSGHDSFMTILKVPTAMLFVRCRNGDSHAPTEWCEKEDCADGAQALGRAVINFDEYLMGT